MSDSLKHNFEEIVWHDKRVRDRGGVRAVITSNACGSSVCWRQGPVRLSQNPRCACAFYVKSSKIKRPSWKGRATDLEPRKVKTTTSSPRDPLGRRRQIAGSLHPDAGDPALDHRSKAGLKAPIEAREFSLPHRETQGRNRARKENIMINQKDRAFLIGPAGIRQGNGAGH